MVKNDKGFQFFLNFIMIIISLICVLPFLLLISSSLTADNDLVKYGYSFIPRHFDLSAYRYLIFGSKSIVRGYAISVLVTVIGTLSSLVLTTLLAYPLSRKNLPGRNFFAFLIFFTMLFNGGLVPSYIMWTQMFHIKNTLWALIIPGLLLNAFNVIMMRSYLTSSIPEEIIEAAKVDGAGEWKTLLSIVLPMSKPIIATLILMIGISYWNDWINGLYYLNDDKLYSIQVLLNRMLQNVEMIKNAASSGGTSMKMPSTSIRMAVAVIGALPILIIYPFFQKSFVKGIIIGAVKG